MEMPEWNTAPNFTNCSADLSECTQPNIAYSLWEVISISCVSLVATPANLIVIVCLWRDPSSKASGFSTYAVSVAFPDLLVGAVLLPIRVVLTSLSWQMGNTGCILYKLLDYGLTSVSMLLYLAMGYDRYCCVTAPLKYHSQFRTSRIIRISVSLWILGILLWTPYILLKTLLYDMKSFTTTCPVFIFGTNIFEITEIVVAYYIPFLALIIMNSILLWTLNTRMPGSNIQKSTTKSRQRPVNISTVRGLVGHYSRPCEPVTSVPVTDVSRAQVSKKKSSKVVSSYKIVILVLVFCVFWVPYFITWPLQGLCRACISQGVREFSGILTYGQSAINPLILIITSHQIRSRMTRACVFL